MSNDFEKSYGFHQVAIKQKKCIVASRNDVKIESEIIKGIFRPIPLIASNMVSVTNSDFCIQLYKLGALGFLHRAFKEESDYIEETKKIATHCPVVAVSIGVKNEDYLLLKKLIDVGANCIVVDIAHGYSNSVLKMCEHIKEFYPQVRVVAGNTVNSDMIKEFKHCIDAIKVGIASGNACETKNTSGCYKPQFSAIYDMKIEASINNIPIISDGGIREPADFVKAIGAGASSVMAGSIFCRCPESAAETIELDGIRKKIYSGMASRKIQEKWHGKVNNDCPEGKTMFLDLGESIDKLLNRYAGALRSGISYSGENNVIDFRKKCEFILI